MSYAGSATPRFIHEGLSPSTPAFYDASLDSITSDILFNFKILREKYQLKGLIGEGTFSKVFLANNIKTNEEVAIKLIVGNSGPVRNSFESDLILRYGGSFFIINFIELLRENDKVAIVMKNFKHKDHREYYLNLEINQLQRYMFALFSALMHLHKNNIIHRDIKGSNFLANEDFSDFALVDFGLAEKTIDIPYCESVRLRNFKTFGPAIIPVPEEKQKYYQALGVEPYDLKRKYKPSGYDSNNKLRSPTLNNHLPAVNRGGTRGFRAPEVLVRYKYHTSAIDIWSVGVCILSIMCRKPILFLSNDDFDALEEISKIFGTKEMEELAFMLKKRVTFSEEHAPVRLEELVTRTVKCSTQCEINWPNSLYDLLNRCLELNPAHRITAQEALAHPFFTSFESKKNLYELIKNMNTFY